MEELTFQPERGFGVAFHLAAMLACLAAAGWGLWQAIQTGVGAGFFAYLIPLLAAAVIIPLLAYRLHALWTGSYTLEREGIRLRWGLRTEEIPMNAVAWVHPASELMIPLSLPWLRWPGAVVGVRRLPRVGEVEFLASRTKDLILIATPTRTYAISPADPAGFLQAFQKLTEMGSLIPIAARSVYPTFLISRIWATPPARNLLLGSLGLSLGLVFVVSLSVPSRTSIHLGFQPDGSPGDVVPAVRLFLLPILNSFFLLIDLFLGLFLFRSEDSRVLAYLLWAGGILTPVLFLVGVFFILQASP